MRLSFLFLALIVFFSSCRSTAKNPNVIVLKIKGVVPFKDGDCQDKKPPAGDSGSLYMPPQMVVTKSAVFFFTKNGREYVIKASRMGMADIIRHYGINRSDIVDTVMNVTDSSWAEWLSYNCYKLKEPILSNCYFGDTTYRITVIPDVGLPPFAIRITKGADIEVITRKLSEPLHMPYKRVYDMSRKGVAVPNNKNLAQLAIDKVKHLDTNAWHALDSLFSKIDFEHTPYINDYSRTGMTILIERQVPLGYSFMERYISINDTFYKQLLKRVIKESDLDERTKILFD